MTPSPATRSLSYWMGRLQALIYCSGHGSRSGSFTEHPPACVCPSGRPLCQHPLPCTVGHADACAACSARNASRCGACNLGYKLQNGRCQPEAAVPQIVAPYMMLESELDLQVWLCLISPLLSSPLSLFHLHTALTAKLPV